MRREMRALLVSLSSRPYKARIDLACGDFRGIANRDLVRGMAALVKAEHRKRHNVLINAAGRFKAQSSLAGLIRQVLSVPVNPCTRRHTVAHVQFHP